MGTCYIVAVRSACLAILLFFIPIHAMAQDGPTTIGVFGTGGFSVPGGTTGVSVGSAGFRLGWVLTGDHGPGVLHGNFAYAIDLVPIYLVHEKANTYGGGFNPVVLQWNFAPHWRDRAAPYIELGGGTLFSNHEVPPGTSTVNFRTHLGVGTHLWSHDGRHPKALTLEVRYEHISNAGLSSPNPGINTVQFLIGYTLGVGLSSSRH